MVAFFLETNQRTRRKANQIDAMIFFYRKSTKNLVKIRPTQKFGPPEANFALLEQRSSCGTGD